MALAITGAGVVTSLGFGLVGSCAGIRAGVAMPRELDCEVDGGDGETTTAIGYPASLVANGFVQAGAWVRLASAATDDLRHAAELPADTDGAFWQRTSMVCALPLIDPDRFCWSLEQVPQAAEDAFLRPLVELSVPSVAGARQWQALGHVGTAAALARCGNAQARQTERAVIATADSYLDPFTLSWLTRAARLKSPDRPTGLMPGEAGAALLVETEQSARQRKTAILGTVEAVALGTIGPRPTSPEEDDDPPPMPAAASLGRALAEAVRTVLPTQRDRDRFSGDLYLDLNGEDWRAASWGHAQVLLARTIDFDRCRTFLPAESLGETGAASAGIAVALALYGFQQDATSAALVLSASEDGSVSAIRLASSTGRPLP
jgi:3-oxoacyl-[acyl-carrier-protein] synthase-1